MRHSVDHTVAPRSLFCSVVAIGLSNRLKHACVYSREGLKVERTRVIAAAMPRRAYPGTLQSVTRRPRWLTRFVNGVARQQVHTRNGTVRLGIANVNAIAEFLIAKGPEETGQILQLLLFWRPWGISPSQQSHRRQLHDDAHKRHQAAAFAAQPHIDRGWRCHVVNRERVGTDSIEA